MAFHLCSGGFFRKFLSSKLEETNKHAAIEDAAEGLL